MRKFAIASAWAAICCLPVGPAAALDAQAFLDRFETALEINLTSDVEFGPVKQKGDVIAVSGMSIGGFCPYVGAGPLWIDGELRFTGVGEGPDGAYHARSLTIPAFEATIEDMGDTIALSLEGIELSDIHLPPGDMEVVDAAKSFSRVRMEGIEARIEGHSVLSVQAIELNSTSAPASGDELFDDIAVAGIEIDLAQILTLLFLPPEAIAAVEDLGLGTLSADLAISQNWILSRDRASAGRMTLRIEDAGSLVFEIGYSGYTAEVWQETTGDLYDVYSTSDCSDPALLFDAEIQSWEVLREAIDLHHARLRYEDDLLVEKLIALVAQMQGTDSVTAGRSLGKTISHLIAARGLGNVGSEIAAFLSAPDSFLLATDLESPISFRRIGDALHGDHTLSQLLRIEATANPGE